MARNRGLYGQSAGDERRQSGSTALEHYQDNDIVEGQESSILRRMMQEGRWKDAEAYMNKLRTEGWSTVRVQCVYAKASFGVKV